MFTSTFRSGRWLTPVVVGLAMVLAGLQGGSRPAFAASPDVVISQVYGGGGNTGAPFTNDFIELFNRGAATVSLAGWSVQYASATGTGNFGSASTLITPLSGALAPGQYLLVQQSAGTSCGGGPCGVALPAADIVDPTPILMAAGGAKVALVNSTTSLGCNGGSTPCPAGALALIVDLVGYDGANFFEGAPAPTASNTTAVIRAGGGCADTDNNAADFTAGAPAPRNSASPLNPCPADLPPAVAGTTPAGGASGVAFNADVSIAFSEPVDAGGSWFSLACGTSGPHTAAVSGGPVTFTLNPDGGFSSGESCTATVYAGQVTDQDVLDPPDNMAADYSWSFTIFAPIPIGQVQGSVGDSANGMTFRSPYAPPSGNGAGQTVDVQGVIYEKTLARTSSGGSQFGFFIQNTAASADSDPNTSDGVFVFMGGFTSLIGGYVPQVGDEVVISARVTEFFSLTELTSARLVTLVRTGVDLDAEVPAFDTNPPDTLADANRYWERREGMRAGIPGGSLVIDSRDVFASTADGEVWLARPDSSIAQRADPYARRAFRDPHPLDNDPALFDDGNGYRIILGSLGLKVASGDNRTLIAPARTFDVLSGPADGGVYFSFNKYQIMVDEQIALAAGVDPALNNPPQPALDGREYAVATFNVENLYDYRDDPFDGCDFTGNAGCPGVNPPFDYVPASDAAYQARLREIAEQIVAELHSPNIILVQEAEDQDICTVTGGALTCGATDNADGKPDTLQELATAIASRGGPAYDAAYDRDGADDRGIVSAFLYRTDHVELLPASPAHPVLGSNPAVDYRAPGLAYNYDVQNPKALNAELPADVDTSTGIDGSLVFTRPPQVGLFRVWRAGLGVSVFTDVYALNNHFSSTPDGRVGQRTEQARYDAAIVAALQAAEPDAYVAVGGDFNVYPRPDDPFAPGHPLYPSDQLGALYDQGLLNLWDTLVAEVPASAYSYIFQGQTQTLDQLFISPALNGELAQMRAAHINSDWPADYDGDGPRGTSDHDPQVARFSLLPTLERLEALLDYYADSGAIRGQETARILRHHLEQARQTNAAGDLSAYAAQLQAFANQAQGFAPQRVDQAAADALAQETELLLSLN